MSILSQIAISQATALSGATIGRLDFFVDSLDDKWKAYDETNTLVSNIVSINAAGVPYTLTVPSDWDASPSQVQSALDELASRVTSIELKTDLITITGAVDLDDVKSKADSALQSGDNVSELVNDAGYVTSSGGVVDSVTGDGVDNTDPANPILSFPDADQVDDTSTTNKFATSADLSAITANTAKVSFPEAPNDGKQYARKDLGWDEITGIAGSSLIACCPFGSKSDDTGKFLIANGKSTDGDDNTKAKTRQPIGVDGTLTKLAYKTKDGSTSTQMKIHINGVVEQTVVLSSMNANDGGVETISISVSAGDYAEIEYDSSQKPGECTMYFIQDIS